MTAQLALPGFAAPDPLAEARAELREVRAAWEKVSHIADSEERSRLQPLYFAALIRVDRLESGRKWWHG
jgi:hypothetical protein